MGTIAGQMIEDILALLEKRDPSLFEKLNALEKEMDTLQTDVDEETIRIIGVYTPVASDLRTLLMITRINIELERIGDQVMNISFYGKSLLKEEPLNHMMDIPRMAEISLNMVNKSLEAFKQKSSKLALSVIDMDDQVDRFHDQIFRSLMTYVIEDPRTIRRILELILIARAFERIADHAVSISEDVVYIVKGEDIRHTDES